MTDEDDESEQIKETFAYFGRATYMANVVETGLAHTLLQIEFMKGVRDEFVRTKGKEFNRKKFEKDFDEFLEKQFAQTMGNLTKRVNESADFDQQLKSRIVAAKERRNYLAHHYWRDMAISFSTADGRAKMISELGADADTFEKLDEDIRAATKPMREQLGIKDELLDARVDELMEKIKAGVSLE